MNKYKCLKLSAGIFIGVLFVVELVLRLVFGFCDALLYRSSDAYEYIAQPNQHRYRFFSHIDYNSYSQRCDEPDTAKTVILGLGDSVIFGGTMIDQDSIATTLFTKKTGMQMLNISAGSWGPDNCAAYLREKGTFGAKAMILVCSSHDAYDVMSHHPVVGVYPNYSDIQYKFATWELLDRYVIPRFKGLFAKATYKPDPDETVAKGSGSVAKKSVMFNPGFDELKTISDTLNIPFVMYLHAETGELRQGCYNQMGQEILSWALSNGVPVMKGLESGEKEYMYRDVIHLNEKGQRHLASCMEKLVADMSLH